MGKKRIPKWILSVYEDDSGIVTQIVLTIAIVAMGYVLMVFIASM